MPKKIDGYQCVMCLHVCESFEAAQTCEKHHGKDFEYESEFERGKVGPSAIKCTFTKMNGEKYVRHYY